MSFELRPYYVTDPQKGQVQQGGVNRFNNCVPDAFLTAFLGLGYGWPLTPQEVTDDLYGPAYIGGEYFFAVANYLETRTDVFPDPPPIVANDMAPNDPSIIDVIDYYGGLGFVVVCSYWCDVNGQIVTADVGYQHASSPVAYDGSWVAVWNVEGYVQSMPAADFVAAFTGGVSVVGRSLYPVPPPAPVPIPESGGQEQMIFETVDPGQCAFIGAPNQDTFFNVTPASLDPGAVEQDGAVQVIFYDPTSRRVLGTTGEQVVKGNDPFVQGPNQVFGQARDYGVSGPCTVGVWNKSPFKLAVTLHQP